MSTQCWPLSATFGSALLSSPPHTAKAAERSKDRLRGVALAGRKGSTYLRVFP